MALAGKTFYSNHSETLEGVIAGAEYVNDGPYQIGAVTESNDPDYRYMVVIVDEEASEMDTAYL